MVKSQAESSGTAVLETIADEAFYHVGMLPAEGDALFPVVEKAGTPGRMKRFPAWTLWNSFDSVDGMRSERGLRMFVAKCRQFLGLTVTGMHFPSTNEFVEQTQDSINRSPFPGGVAKLSKEQLTKIVKSCYRHIVRYANGFAKMDDPTQAVEIINLDFGAKPDGMSDSEWSTYKAHNAVPQQPVFNAKTDKYVAEFVYIEKLDVEIEPGDMEDYRKNPNRFHYQWIGPVKRSFFTEPPKSVAKMFPREA